MRIRVLIVSGDRDYVDHLSAVMSRRDDVEFSVDLASSPEKMKEMLQTPKYDILLVDEAVLGLIDKNFNIALAVLTEGPTQISDSVFNIAKYQRISNICSLLMQILSKSGWKATVKSGDAHIVAVWSPSGGVGKTTVALAYAVNKSFKRVSYLSLEDFASTPIYFPLNDKSISRCLLHLGGDFVTNLLSIRQRDGSSGIYYYESAENYEDILLLKPEDMESIVKGTSAEMDYSILDLSSKLDKKTKQILDMADEILIVVDETENSIAKMRAFSSQGSLFAEHASKCILVLNRGARAEDYDFVTGVRTSVSLPFLPNNNAHSLYKQLSSANF